MYGMLLALTAAAVGADWGYRPLADGGYEYIIQVQPRDFDALVNGGGDIVSDVPSFLRDVRKYRVTVGSQRLPRGGGARASRRPSEPAQGVHVRWLNVRGGAYEHVIELDPSAVTKMREEMDLVDNVRNVRRFRIRLRGGEPAPREVARRPPKRVAAEPTPVEGPWRPKPIPSPPTNPEPPLESTPPLAPVKHLSPTTPASLPDPPASEPMDNPAPADFPPIEPWPPEPENPPAQPDPAEEPQEAAKPLAPDDPPPIEEPPPGEAFPESSSEDPFAWPNVPEEQPAAEPNDEPPIEEQPALPPGPEHPAVEDPPYGTDRVDTPPPAAEGPDATWPPLPAADPPPGVSTGTVPPPSEPFPPPQLSNSLADNTYPSTDLIDDGGPQAEPKARMASAVVDSNDKRDPWWLLTVALFGLFAAVGGVVYLAWINWGMRRQYASLLAVVKQQRGKDV